VTITSEELQKVELLCHKIDAAFRAAKDSRNEHRNTPREGKSLEEVEYIEYRALVGEIGYSALKDLAEQTILPLIHELVPDYKSPFSD